MDLELNDSDVVVENVHLSDSLMQLSYNIASRGKIGEDYPLLLSGIKKIATHIFDDSFNAEMAVLRACKVMYIAASVLCDVEPVKIVDPNLYHSVSIAKSKYNKLSKIRNSEPLGYAYVVESLKLIDSI